MNNLKFSLLFSLLLSVYNISARCIVNFDCKTIQNDSQIYTATLYVFSGSDWCAPCINLYKKVLNRNEFLQKMDSGNIQLQIIDFPQRTQLSPELLKYNESVSERFGFEGSFPTLVIYSFITRKFKTFDYRNQSAVAFYIEIVKNLRQLNE